MTYHNLEELTFACLNGEIPEVCWPCSMKRPGTKYQFGLLYKCPPHAFVLMVSGEKYALDFDSADAVIQAGWFVD